MEQALREFVIKLTIITVLLKFIYILIMRVFTNVENEMINFVTRTTNKSRHVGRGFIFQEIETK